MRIQQDLVARLEAIAQESNRSRNNVIQLLLEAAVNLAKVGEAE